MSETSNITRPILEALTKAGYFVLRLNSGVAKMGRYRVKLCPVGTADLVVFPPHALPLWIETKAVKRDHHRNTREAQAEFAFKVEALGHKYVIARSLDDVLEKL
jgi:hypothetical protein